MKKLTRLLAMMLVLVVIAGTMTTYVDAASKKKAVKSVTITNLNDKTLVLKANKTFQLKTKVTVTGNASKRVYFGSSNRKVVSVSRTGKIRALKSGTAYISAISAGNYNKRAVVKVIVGTPVTKVSLNKTKVTAYEGNLSLIHI